MDNRPDGKKKLTNIGDILNLKDDYIQLLESRLKVAEDALKEACEASECIQEDFNGDTHEISANERIYATRKILNAWKKTKEERA